MIDDAKLAEWKTTLFERIRRLKNTPKNSWFTAIGAIEVYGNFKSPQNFEFLKKALKEAEIYVPRDLE